MSDRDPSVLHVTPVSRLSTGWVEICPKAKVEVGSMVLSWQPGVLGPWLSDALAPFPLVVGLRRWVLGVALRRLSSNSRFDAPRLSDTFPDVCVGPNAGARTR